MENENFHDLAADFESVIIEYLKGKTELSTIPSDYIQDIISKCLIISIDSNYKQNFIIKNKSIKLSNITLNLNKALNYSVDVAVLIPTSYSEADIAKMILYAIYKIMQLSSIEITNNDATILSIFNLKNMYNYPISDDNIINIIMDYFNEHNHNMISEEDIKTSINHLCKCRCIEKLDNCWYLKERVLLGKKYN